MVCPSDKKFGGGITPSGTIQITENGTVDVTNYATADVQVAGGEPWITIREFTIDEPAKVDVNTDSEGNPFAVRKLRIHIYNPTTPMPHARINTVIDGCQNTYFYSYFQTSRVEYYVIEISEKIGNLCKFNFMQTSHNPEAYMLVGSGCIWSTSIRYKEKITKVYFDVNSGNFPSGTQIKVEGVI